MLVTSSGRAELLAALAQHVMTKHPPRRIRVAIDGVDGAGKSIFADELAQRIASRGRPVVRASVDSFHRPRIERYRLGRASPTGFYRDSYDYQLLAEFLLDPFAPGGSGRFRAAAFDHRTDTRDPASERQAAVNAVLVLDGIFLHRPELRDLWDFSIFLHVRFDVSVERCASRDGTSPDPAAAGNQRYVEGQRRYFREAQPWQRATVIVDNTDLAAPAVIAPDVVNP
jgi:uridine kinase